MLFSTNNRTAKNSNNIKRLCIYFFYDKDGVVDDYVIYYLNAIKKYCSEICVVTNGFLTEESEYKIKKVSNKFIIRNNEGFDSWAYKEALYSYGFDFIAQNFDEVLLNNFTCFGPIGSFEPMFEKMDKKTCDFWGHCWYFPQGDFVKDMLIPKHLMSYFLVFRSNILKSKEWVEYWETLKPVYTYDDARINHEFRCTQYFEDLGFKSESFIDTKRPSTYKQNSPVFDSYYQLKYEKSPLLKRKVFFLKNEKYFHCREYSRYNDLLYYMVKKKLYDINLIFDNLIRTGDFSFSKNKMTFFNKAKLAYGQFFNIKHYLNKYSKFPDYDFIKKNLKKVFV